ncbi:MAG: hypothetical protein MZV70_39780 [Desulfobacterales bacterium]|nr:hypothetical protein [Desulfobacterales bacterium]
MGSTGEAVDNNNSKTSGIDGRGGHQTEGRPPGRLFAVSGTRGRPGRVTPGFAAPTPTCGTCHLKLATCN